MDVKVWPNSRSGSAHAGFGIRISAGDSTRFFKSAAPVILIEADGRTAAKTLPPSFWTGCTEIRHKVITAFIVRNGLTVWRKGHPPVLKTSHPAKTNSNFRSKVRLNVLPKVRHRVCSRWRLLPQVRTTGSCTFVFGTRSDRIVPDETTATERERVGC